MLSWNKIYTSWRSIQSYENLLWWNTDESVKPQNVISYQSETMQKNKDLHGFDGEL